MDLNKLNNIMKAIEEQLVIMPIDKLKNTLCSIVDNDQLSMSDNIIATPYYNFDEDYENDLVIEDEFTPTIVSSNELARE